MGCIFNPRCAHALDQCRTEPQFLRSMHGGLVRCWRAETISGLVHDTQAGSEYARSPRPGAALLDVTDLRKTYPLGRRVKLGGPGSSASNAEPSTR